jgi:hypothetical protein
MGMPFFYLRLFDLRPKLSGKTGDMVRDKVSGAVQKNIKLAL